jgi:hypothetical protein
VAGADQCGATEGGGVMTARLCRGGSRRIEIIHGHYPISEAESDQICAQGVAVH